MVHAINSHYRRAVLRIVQRRRASFDWESRCGLMCARWIGKNTTYTRVYYYDHDEMNYAFGRNRSTTTKTRRDDRSGLFLNPAVFKRYDTHTSMMYTIVYTKLSAR
jgi:hypothetical protein